MLSENIKNIRKQKGLSQQDLAEKLHVVRQTISKWEQGLSVPDVDLLIKMSEVLEMPVSTLLGETISETQRDDLQIISQQLENINFQLAKQKEKKRKTMHWLFISLCLFAVIIFIALILLKSPYLNWDYSDPETSVLGVAFHSFEWITVRIAPIIFIVSLVGACLTRKKPVT